MKRAFILIPAVALFLWGGRALAAEPRDEASPADLQRLQDDLVNLDDDMRDLETGEGRADDFRKRADDIREDVTYLEAKMRRHQRTDDEGTGVPLSEVDDVRRAIRDLREDIEEAFRGEAHDLRVPAGAEFLVRLEDPLSSRTARAEDRFEATVVEPVRVGHHRAIPAGSRIRGVVRHAEIAEKPSRPGRLDLEFDRLFLGPMRLDMRANLVAVEGGDRTTARKAGLGAILGGMIGGILGGHRGVLVGAVLGSTGAVVATKGDDVDLPPGALLTIRLSEDLVVPAPRRY